MSNSKTDIEAKKNAVALENTTKLSNEEILKDSIGFYHSYAMQLLGRKPISISEIADTLEAAGLRRYPSAVVADSTTTRPYWSLSIRTGIHNNTSLPEETNTNVSNATAVSRATQ